MSLKYFRVSKLKMLTCLLVTISLLVLFTGGCSQPGTAPSQQNGETGSELEQQYQPQEFNLCHFMPPMHPLHSNVLVPWAEEIEQKTDGRVKIFVYPANELAAADKNYDATLSG